MGPSAQQSRPCDPGFPRSAVLGELVAGLRIVRALGDFQEEALLQKRMNATAHRSHRGVYAFGELGRRQAVGIGLEPPNRGSPRQGA